MKARRKDVEQVKKLLRPVFSNIKKLFVVFFLVFFIFSVNVGAIGDYIGSPTPSDGSIDISYVDNVTTCVVVDKLDGCSLDLYFYENSSGSWVEYQNYSDVSGGQSYCGNFSIVCGSTFFWRVAGFIDCGQGAWWENQTFSFSSVDCPVSHVVPSNNSIDLCPCCLALCARLVNLSGDSIKFSFLSNYSGVWKALEDSRIVSANESYCICVPEFVWFNYTYYWKVAYNVGNGTEYSDVFCFTTASHVEDCPCGEGYSGSTVVDEDFVFWFFLLLAVVVLLSVFFIVRGRL